MLVILASGLASPLAAQTPGPDTAGPQTAAPQTAAPQITTPQTVIPHATAAHRARGAAPPSDEDDDDASGARETRLSGVDVVAHKDYAHQIGAVVGDITPEIQLSPADIRTYGVSTVNELLSELAPETRSDRGRGGGSPVVLLNGRRISGLGEVQNIPTEAILRIDILPEEVSLKYGYSADQRVVNIVLRRRFRAVTAEAVGGGATEGAQVTDQAELDLLHIRRDDRLNLDVKYNGATPITEADRGIFQPAPAAPYDQLGNLAADRDLAAATQSLTANAVLAHPLPHGINATVNATLGATSSDSLRGLSGFGLTVPADDPFSTSGTDQAIERYGTAPLHQYVNSWTAHLSSTLNKDVHAWRLSLTDGYDHSDSQTDTDTGVDPAPLQALLNAGSTSFNPFAALPGGLAMRPQSVSRSISDAVNVQVLANGPVLRLPAGNLYVSAKGGDTQSWQSGASTREGVFQAVSLSRNDLGGQLNIDVPLTSRRNRILAFLGDMSVNANGAIDQLSDYGTLKAFGYGLNWTPIPGYNLIVSHTNDQAAPTIQQLGGAVVYTPGVTVFDYATGQTVNVTQVNGGNPGLIADNRNVLKIGLTLKPIETQDLSITVNYIKSDIDNPIATFPAASGPIEAAFPARFARDENGDLVEEDIRPVNFARSERSEIRWGVTYSRPIGKQPPPRQFPRGLFGGQGRRAGGDAGDSGGAPGGPPGGAGTSPGGPGDSTRARGGSAGDSGGGYGRGPGGGPGGGRFGGGAFPSGGRLQFAVYHTVYLTDRELVRPGGPTLDLLNGAPASGTGGQYRNEIEGQLGMTMAGFGARLSADWRQGTQVAGVPGSPTGNLSFSDITSLNLRLFDNFGQQPAVIRRYPWLRGARLTLAITNLLDERVTVRDAYGVTPLGYQPGYIDPVGRAITLSFRKLFF